MQDLTGAAERRTTVILALLIAAAMCFPVVVSAQEAPEPATSEPTSEPTPSPTPTPTPTTSASEAPVGELGDRVDIPILPSDSESPSPEPTGPAEVEAEGDDPDEVAAPPVAPEPTGGEADGEEIAAAGDEPSPAPGEPAASEAAIEPPPAEAYGPQLTPSLGTASAPLTNEMADFDAAAPLVMSPQVAGQAIQAGGAAPSVAGSVSSDGIFAGVQPVQDVAAATLSIVQPSWYATAFALLILLAAASYAAVLRSRGDRVPEALSIVTAIRPADASVRAARSVRPADQGVVRARSVRP